MMSATPSLKTVFGYLNPYGPCGAEGFPTSLITVATDGTKYFRVYPTFDDEFIAIPETGGSATAASISCLPNFIEAANGTSSTDLNCLKSFAFSPTNIVTGTPKEICARIEKEIDGDQNTGDELRRLIDEHQKWEKLSMPSPSLERY